jgi:hypothetical protein
MMIGLLDACITNLQTQGMRKMFLDGVANGLDDLKALGKSSAQKFSVRES